MEREQSTNEFTVEKIQIDYVNNLIKILVFLMGGELTLLGTVFKDFDNKEYALLAIFFMILAIFIAYSIVENIVRRISKKPEFENKVMKFLVEKLSTSIKAEWIKSVFASICLFLSLLFYFIFAWNGLYS